MLNKLSILIESTQANAFSWELAATIFGVAALIIEAVIRIYVHNSKMKNENVKTESNNNNTISLTDAEINYLKNVAQSVMNNTNKISNLEIQIKNLENVTDDLKALIRDVERENFNSLSSVSDKIDVLKNILLEAKMNSKK